MALKWCLAGERRVGMKKREVDRVGLFLFEEESGLLWTSLLELAWHSADGCGPPAGVCVALLLLDQRWCAIENTSGRRLRERQKMVRSTLSLHRIFAYESSDESKLHRCDDSMIRRMNSMWNASTICMQCHRRINWTLSRLRHVTQASANALPRRLNLKGVDSTCTNLTFTRRHSSFEQHVLR